MGRGIYREEEEEEGRITKSDCQREGVGGGGGLKREGGLLELLWYLPSLTAKVSKMVTTWVSVPDTYSETGN